jgi:hypothetical protein
MDLASAQGKGVAGYRADAQEVETDGRSDEVHDRIESAQSTQLNLGEVHPMGRRLGPARDFQRTQSSISWPGSQWR